MKLKKISKLFFEITQVFNFCLFKHGTRRSTGSRKLKKLFSLSNKASANHNKKIFELILISLFNSIF